MSNYEWSTSDTSDEEKLTEDFIENVKQVIPRKSDLNRLARFFNIDLDEYPASTRADMLKILSRLYTLLKYSSMVTNLRNDTAVIGGVAVSILLAQKNEKPRFTIDVDIVMSQGEIELKNMVDELNDFLEQRRLVVRIPIGYGEHIDIGKVRILQPVEKLGKRVVPLIYSNFIYGEGRHFEDYLSIVAKKEGKKFVTEVVKRIRQELRKLGDVRVDGMKIAVAINTPPSDPVNIEIPGIGAFRVNSPVELIKAKLDILRTPLNWENASVSIKINWAVDIVKSILDLRLLRYYDINLNLSDVDRRNIIRNIENTLKIFNHVVRTTIIRRTVFVEEPFDELANEIIRRVV